MLLMYRRDIDKLLQQLHASTRLFYCTISITSYIKDILKLLSLLGVTSNGSASKPIWSRRIVFVARNPLAVEEVNFIPTLVHHAKQYFLAASEEVLLVDY